VPGLQRFFEYLQENHRSHEVVAKNPSTQSAEPTVKVSPKTAGLFDTLFWLHLLIVSADLMTG
jgi:hypothetical protein